MQSHDLGLDLHCFLSEACFVDEGWASRLVDLRNSRQDAGMLPIVEGSATAARASKYVWVCGLSDQVYRQWVMVTARDMHHCTKVTTPIATEAQNSAGFVLRR